MLRCKSCISIPLISLFLLFSSNALAFTMPTELASLDTLSFSGSQSGKVNKSTASRVSDKGAKHIKAELLAKYSHWKGTKYKFGGTTLRGVDCSALMQHLFDDALNKQLPRTTSKQIKHGRQVSKQNLKPGDLVFFKTTPTERHVGVYVGNKQFIHASRTKGVTISSLENPYWVDRYETARRLLES